MSTLLHLPKSMGFKSATMEDYEVERQMCPVEIKAGDINNEGSFEGYAAVFGNVDQDDDQIEPGAFTETLLDTKGVVPIFFQHDSKILCGLNRTAVQDDTGLKVQGALFKQTDAGKMVLEYMRTAVDFGSRVGLSIGYVVPEGGYNYKDGVRHLTKLILKEYSVVTWPANELAAVTKVKSTVPFQDLGLADKSRGWDAGAARGRIKAWATVNGKINMAKYKRCFLWYDESKPADVGSYKLPIADIVDGKPVAIPKGIAAAAGALHGGRGTGVDIPEADKATCISHLERYYKKLGEDSPFKEDKPKASGEEVTQPAGIVPTAAGEPTQVPGDNIMDFNQTLDGLGKRDEHLKALRNIENAHDKCMKSIYTSDQNATEKKAAIGKLLMAHKDALEAWHCKNIDMGSPVGEASYGYMSAALEGLIERKNGTGGAVASIGKLNRAQAKAITDKIEAGVKSITEAHNDISGLAVEIGGTDPVLGPDTPAPIVNAPVANTDPDAQTEGGKMFVGMFREALGIKVQPAPAAK